LKELKIDQIMLAFPALTHFIEVAYEFLRADITIGIKCLSILAQVHIKTRGIHELWTKLLRTMKR
jgi:hypothetical protein